MYIKLEVTQSLPEPLDQQVVARMWRVATEMSSVSSCATWRVTACWCAATVLSWEQYHLLLLLCIRFRGNNHLYLIRKQTTPRMHKYHCHCCQHCQPFFHQRWWPETLVQWLSIPYTTSTKINCRFTCKMLYLPPGISISSGANSLHLRIGMDGKSIIDLVCFYHWRRFK